jgi:hypothetical protein
LDAIALMCRRLFLTYVFQQVWNITIYAVIGGCEKLLSVTQSAVRLQKNNEAAARLLQINSWWGTNNYGEKVKSDNVSSLVQQGEHAILENVSATLQALPVAVDQQDQEDEDGASPAAGGARASAGARKRNVNKGTKFVI